MKKISILVIACLLLTGWQVAGFCQEDEGVAITAGLGSEISEEQSLAENEISQMDESMDTGGMTN